MIYKLEIDPQKLNRLIRDASKRLLADLGREGGLMDQEQDRLVAGVEAHLNRLIRQALE